MPQTTTLQKQPVNKPRRRRGEWTYSDPYAEEYARRLEDEAAYDARQPLGEAAGGGVRVLRKKLAD